MNPLRVSFILLATLAGLALSARAAALVWEKDTIVADTEPKAGKFSTEFKFRNASEHPVTITGIEPGCRCTAADLEKRTYATGEAGVLPVTFTFGDFAGPQEKMVFVQTDESDAKPIPLTLRVNITELALLDPVSLVWQLGEEPVEKAIECRATTAKAVIVVATRFSAAGFTSRVAAIETGRAYRVFVKPASTAERLSASLAIQALVSDAGERTYEAAAAIR